MNSIISEYGNDLHERVKIADSYRDILETKNIGIPGERFHTKCKRAVK